MSRKIIGITVGTTMSPASMERKLRPVKSVNGVGADETGNVEIEVKDGYTPVKGIDYYTEDERQELIDTTANLVLSMLPSWEGGSY